MRLSLVEKNQLPLISQDSIRLMEGAGKDLIYAQFVAVKEEDSNTIYGSAGDDSIDGGNGIDYKLETKI